MKKKKKDKKRREEKDKVDGKEDARKKVRVR